MVLYVDRPGNIASCPSCSSMRSRRLYFAVRSPRAGAPALICPAPVATAISDIESSVVSPERWLIIVPQFVSCAKFIAVRVSEIVPIWFIFIV